MFNVPYKIDFSDRSMSHQIAPLIAERWSPRAFKKQRLDREIVETLGEAARWSPSSYNMQPWRIILAENDTEDFEKYVELLMDRNKIWVKTASLLGFFVAKLHHDNGDSAKTTAAFDTGFAWGAFTFQARTMGLYTHAMSGLDYEAAYKELNINKDNYALLAAVAVGVLDNKEVLPPKVQEMEKPHGHRKELSEIFFFGKRPDLQ